jgi:hypothetical protein
MFSRLVKLGEELAGLCRVIADAALNAGQAAERPLLPRRDT